MFNANSSLICLKVLEAPIKFTASTICVNPAIGRMIALMNMKIKYLNNFEISFYVFVSKNMNSEML